MIIDECINFISISKYIMYILYYIYSYLDFYFAEAEDCAAQSSSPLDVKDDVNDVVLSFLRYKAWRVAVIFYNLMICQSCLLFFLCSGSSVFKSSRAFQVQRISSLTDLTEPRKCRPKNCKSDGDISTPEFVISRDAWRAEDPEPLVKGVSDDQGHTIDNKETTPWVRPYV